MNIARKRSNHPSQSLITKLSDLHGASAINLAMVVSTDVRARMYTCKEGNLAWRLVIRRFSRFRKIETVIQTPKGP